LQEPFHAPLFEAMLDAAAVGEGRAVLDVGCGGGGLSVLATARGARPSGLDAAETLVEIARRRVPGGDFRVGEMELLPFPEHSFDAVLFANSLQYAEDRLAALGEARRVCARGGRIAIGLWGEPDRVEYRSVFSAVRAAMPVPPPGKGPFELSGPGVLRELVESAGMTVVDGGVAACPFDYPDFETFWRANVAAGPVQAALGQVAESDLRDSLRAALSELRSGDGSLRFENELQYVVAELEAQG